MQLRLSEQPHLLTGFYNLPKEEQDQYNKDPTQEELRATWEAKRKERVNRSNKMISPYPKETLKSFSQRLDIIDGQLHEQAIQEHMYGVRGAWYVHKRTQNCFICDLITNNTQKSKIITSLLQSSKKLTQKTFDNEGNLESHKVTT